MKRFLERYDDRIEGILSGFDRVVFRGWLTSINYPAALQAWLNSQGILLKDCKGKFKELSEEIKEGGQALAEQQKRPYRYICSPKESKEEWARSIQEKDKIQEGLICVVGCVESCRTFRVGSNWTKRGQPRLVLRVAYRKCLHLYFYYLDRELGLMHIRIETWLPFMIQVCCNGREYLARQMDRRGINYQRRGNCFPHIEKLSGAQRILDRLHERKWAPLLHVFASRANPLLGHGNLSLRHYYWTFWESEYATDLMFRQAKLLDEIYPALVRQAIHHFHSQDVLRFLGRRTNIRFGGEVRTHLAQRMEGVRVRHWVEENSIKMYDKQGSVLRIETTINDPRRFRVRRRVMRQGQRVLAWVNMRKGIADIRRRVEVSRAANQRYLEALSVVGLTVPSHRLLDPVSRPVVIGDRRYRRLEPIAPNDCSLFAEILRGEYAIDGFRNRELFEHARQRHPKLRPRAVAAWITRRLRLSRAHGLIFKVPNRSLYRITEKGRTVMTRALELREYSGVKLAA